MARLGKIHYRSYSYDPKTITHGYWNLRASSWVSALRITYETQRGSGRKVIEGAVVKKHLDVVFNDGFQCTYFDLADAVADYHLILDADVHGSTTGKLTRRYLYNQLYTDLLMGSI